MAHKLANRAWMSTATAGTGTITLGSALSGYQSFADAGISDGDTLEYTIIDGSNWEIGTGTYTASGTSLSRAAIIESSNSDNAINLSGSASVFITSVATKLPHFGIAGTWTAVQGYGETALTWNAGGTTAWDVSTAPNATVTAATSNTTFGAPSNVTAGRFYHLRFVQASPALSITWNANYKFIGGAAPNLSSGSGDIDHFFFYGRSGGVLEEIGRAQDLA